MHTNSVHQTPTLWSEALAMCKATGESINFPSYVFLQDVRALCDEYTKKGLPNFPTGIPFNYWELYLHLHGYLWMGVGVVLAATLFVLAASLMNVWAALIIVSISLVYIL